MALCGYHPLSITSSLGENSKVQAMEDHIEHQQEFLQLLKDNINLVQNQMKQQAYQHCSKKNSLLDQNQIISINLLWLPCPPFKHV